MGSDNGSAGGYFRLSNRMPSECIKWGATATYVFLALCKMANDQGLCWPSVNRLSRELKIHPRSIQKALRVLRAHRAIKIWTVTADADGYGIRSNTYEVCEFLKPREANQPPVPLAQRPPLAVEPGVPLAAEPPVPLAQRPPLAVEPGVPLAEWPGEGWPYGRGTPGRTATLTRPIEQNPVKKKETHSYGKDPKARQRTRTRTREGAPARGATDFDPMALEFPAVLATVEFAEVWANWVSHRNETKHPLTPTSARQQLKRLAGWGPDRAIAALEHTISQGWQGIREPDQGTIPNPRSSNLIAQYARRHGNES